MNEILLHKNLEFFLNYRINIIKLDGIMKVHYGPLFCFKKRMLVNKINDKSNSSCYDDYVNTKLQNDTSQLQKLLQYNCLEVLEVPQKCAEKRSNFSIDYILGISEKTTQVCSYDQSNAQYDWLNYTRYKPPKLQSKYNSNNFEKVKKYVCPWFAVGIFSLSGAVTD